MKNLLLCGVVAAMVPCGTLIAQTTNVNVAPKILESYVGQYELGPGMVLTIRKEGDRLTGQPSGQPRLRLIPTSETDFRVSGVDASVTFVKDKDGKISQLVVHQNGDHEAPKTSSEVPKEHVAMKMDPKAYAAYVGQYELAGGDVLMVRRDGDKLRAQLT